MAKISRARIDIRGAVQGVGFRPFVYRLAMELSLCGWVSNSRQGVSIEAEGSKEQLDAFLLRLERQKPPRSFIQSLEFSILDAVGFPDFAIRASDEAGETTTLVLPDIATCAYCLREIFDPTNRRYLYPFTNCTNCGPRFTIIQSLPYDRPNTTMRIFNMCEACREEYENPLDRRFHAQPNACPECGPGVELWDEQGNRLAVRHPALLQAVEALCDGRILAVKGLGGFHLLVDARNSQAVSRLRERKHRDEKPFALMYPSLGLVKRDCEVSQLEERLLLSPERPIVLLRRKPGAYNGSPPVSSKVAPGHPCLGIMLPYTPVHHLLMHELEFPVVATSGNQSDEPISIDETDAIQRLGKIADVFLVHNRPIVRHVDDSVVRVVLGRELVLRRARGYAPLPIMLQVPADSILAVGAHLKNVVAITASTHCPSAGEDELVLGGPVAKDGPSVPGPWAEARPDAGHFSTPTQPGQVFISQHIGDLETAEAYGAFRKVISDFRFLYNCKPKLVVCDLHPDYLSSQYAKEYAMARGIPFVPIQHHYAHVTACMAENQLEAPALGVSWDGTGYGLDGTIWGGEFLLADETSFQRVGHFRHFKLPGGEAAIKEPRRAALGVLFELLGDRLAEQNQIAPVQQFHRDELSVLWQMLARGINSPRTSSVGRLFDAMASILGLRHTVTFEGQAAMELESKLLEKYSERYDCEVQKREILIVDWEPMIEQVLSDLHKQVSIDRIVTKFHNALVEVIVVMARRIGEQRVVLTGGCFQNKYLLERAVERLETAGFRPYWHQRVPPNDGGIALGQVFAAVRGELHRDARMASSLSVTA
jgi:hydrogenase maturation protein HypF